jgi:hypothetical protein
MTEFINPGPDRSPIHYTENVRFLIMPGLDQLINESHQGLALGTVDHF